MAYYLNSFGRLNETVRAHSPALPDLGSVGTEFAQTPVADTKMVRDFVQNSTPYLFTDGIFIAGRGKP